jgi:PEGA domain
MDELRTLSATVDSVTELADLRPLFARVESIAKENSGEPQIEAVVKQLKLQLVNRGKFLKEAGALGTITAALPSGELPVATPYSQMRHGDMPTGPTIPIPTGEALIPPRVNPRNTVEASNQSRTETTDTSTAPTPISGSRPASGGVFQVPRKPGTTPVAPPNGLNWKRAIAIGAALGLVGFAGIFVLIVNLARNKNKVPTPPPPPSGAMAVQITTLPAGAKIQINGDDKCTSPCAPELPPGNYRITAQLEGYDSTLSVATVSAGQPAPGVTMTLTSQAQSLRIFSDLPGKVVLDGKPAGDVLEGSFILDRVPAGPHTVGVASVGADASFAFDVTPGKLPQIKGTTVGHNILAVLVASSSNQARLQSSAGPLKAKLDGQDQPNITTTGTDLPNAPPGDHELMVGEGKDLKKISVSFLATPTLTAYLKSDVNAGNLVVVTSPPEDDVTIYVNGKPLTKKTSRGQARFPLLPSNVNVRVGKDGFADVPEQAVAIKKGEDTRIEFKLKSLPRVSALNVKGATSGASVYLDGRELGKVGADGVFQTGSVTPGDHVVEFRMPGFMSQAQSKTFKAGEKVDIPNIILIQAVGTISLSVSPSDARVLLRHETDPERQVTTGTIGNLPPGKYLVTARAPGFLERKQTITVSPGQTTVVEVALAKEAVTVPTLKAGTIADFDPAWTRDGEEYTHGGGPAVFRVTPTFGTFSFKVQIIKKGGMFGKGKIRWAFAYGGTDTVTYELEKNKFRRIENVNGKSSKRPDYKIDASMDTFPVQIQVSPAGISHRIQIGGQWTLVDNYPEGGSFASGKFAFLVGSSDVISISEFHFAPVKP